MLSILHSRFLQHPTRHPNLKWEDIEARLLAHPETLKILQKMEETGGEPDVVAFDEKQESIYFLIARQKARQADEASAMTEQLSTNEKRINRKARWRISLVKSG